MHAQWYRIRSEKKIGGSPLLLGKRNRKKHEAVETVNVVFGKKEKEEEKFSQTILPTKTSMDS